MLRLRRIRSRRVDEVRWRTVSMVEDLITAREPALMWIAAAQEPPPPTELLFPDLANDEVRDHHTLLPTGAVPIGIASMPDAVISGRSLVGSSSRLFRLGPVVPGYVDDYLSTNSPVGDRELFDKSERVVPGAAVLLTHWNSGTYGHWLLEGLTKLLFLRRNLDRLPPIRIVLPESLPPFARAWIDVVLPGITIERFDDRVEFLRVETLLMPTLPCSVPSYHFHPAVGALLAELTPSVPAHSPGGLYVTRVQPSHYRQLSNQDEIEDIAASEGLHVVKPETMSVPEQLALFAGATVVVGEFGSGMHNALFGPPGVAMLCLNWINGLQSRIAELKYQRVGYLLPSSGIPVTYVLGAESQSYHIDPHQFRSCVRTLLSR